MKIVLDRQTTEVHIKKNVTNVDFSRCFWNVTFLTDFNTDGNVNDFMKLVCKFLNEYSDAIKVFDTGTEVRVVADSRTGKYSFTVELKEKTTLTEAEITRPPPHNSIID
ncbi:MAG: hypothetical protein K2K02_07820 [Ruminococcus sp.]|nr:hypothetical protein [Ruminococcus sp.]